MKNMSSISIINHQRNSKDEEEKILKKGITQELLEKYKPKGICNITPMREKNIQSRVA